ncbi:MAG: sigma factor [Wenzhouxiangellaceae bacterium]
MNRSTYQQCLAIAKRLAYHPEDAADLLHDALLIAASEGRLDLSDRQQQAWLAGVMKKRAAMDYRSARRRQQREQDWSTPAGEDRASPESDSAAIVSLPLGTLPPAIRQIAALVLHGLDRQEIAWILDLSPTALRQRLSQLRRGVAQLQPAARAAILARAYQQRDGADAPDDMGVIRRYLMRALRYQAGLGATDPDGHLLIFDRNSRSH